MITMVVIALIVLFLIVIGTIQKKKNGTVRTSDHHSDLVFAKKPSHIAMR
jgi:hypothetical protein